MLLHSSFSFFGEWSNVILLDYALAHPALAIFACAACLCIDWLHNADSITRKQRDLALFWLMAGCLSAPLLLV